MLYWGFTILLALLIVQSSAAVVWSAVLIELLKTALMWLMPPLVFFVVSRSVHKLGRATWGILLLLVLFEIISNTLSAVTGLVCGSLLGILSTHVTAPLQKGSAEGALTCPPAWWSPTIFMATSVAVGAYMQNAHGILRKVWEHTAHMAIAGMCLFMPWIARGLLLGYLCTLIGSAGWSSFIALQPILIVMMPALILYLVLLHGVAAHFNIQRWLKQMANCMPATGVAFSSCSSLDALPWSIRAARLNCSDAEAAEMIAPITASIQMPGDCFINLFLISALLPLYGHSLPDGFALTLFVAHFVINRFAAVGIPGGALMLMLPLYEDHLNAPEQLMGIMILMNSVLDPLVAASNVFGNGALLAIFERVRTLAGMILTRR